MKSDDIGSVIDRIYEAAARPELWRPVLHEMAGATQAVGIQMLHHRPEGASLHAASQGLDDILEAFFREGWNVNNPREMRARRRGVRTDAVITESDLFTPEELDREPWQRDFLDRFGLKWFASFCLRPLIESVPFILSIERAAARSAFDSRELAILTAMVPHVQRAIRMSIAIGAAAQTGMIDALTALNHPAMLLNDLGHIVRMNEAAEALIGDGILADGRRLRAANRFADPALQRLLSSVCWAGAACQAPAVDAVPVPRENRRPLIVQASPLVNSARDLFQQVRALVLLNDLEGGPEPDETLLRYAFTLTPAEVRVAKLIAAGRGVVAAAAALSLSPHTAKTHLKAIFAKTGTHNQSELAVLLSRVKGTMDPE